MAKKEYTKEELKRGEKAVRWFGNIAVICLIVGVVFVFIRKSILKSLEKPSLDTLLKLDELKRRAELFELLAFILICGGIGLILMALISAPYIRKKLRAIEKSDNNDT